MISCNPAEPGSGLGVQIGLKDPSLLKNYAHINGAWYSGEQNAKTFDVINPATTEVVASLPDLTACDCEKAVNGAAKAFHQLKTMTGKQRGQVLRKWYDLVNNAAKDLASIISTENGKPLHEAQAEVKYTADFLDWFAGEAPRIDGSVIGASTPANRVLTVKQPIGIVGIVTPWNFPAAMIARKVGAAIAAGCPSVVKPAAETPLTALALAELGRRAGFPAGALSIVTTREATSTVGKVLTQHPQIRKFSFTGSTAVGKMLAAQCTTTMKRMSLELGGNAPFVVFDDADLVKAADAVLSCKFRLSGQTYVIVRKVKEFHLGPATDPMTTHGPLVSEKAVQKVKTHVDDAVKRGGKILIGGKPASSLGPAFFEPTVIADVSLLSLCLTEETFGPLLPLIRFETEEEVIRLANEVEVGLAGYLFSDNISRVWRVAEAMEVGMVGVNTGMISDPASPFGGMKESGQGREGSKIGIDEFLEVKSITFGIGP